MRVAQHFLLKEGAAHAGTSKREPWRYSRMGAGPSQRALIITSSASAHAGQRVLLGLKVRVKGKRS